jgi:hypothetical protein
LQGALLRGAGAIVNGFSGGSAAGVPDYGLWKSTGVAALALLVNALLSWALLVVLFKDSVSAAPGTAFFQLMATQVVALPASVLVVAALSVLLLPAPFSRAALTSLVWAGLFLLAAVIFFGLLRLLISVNNFEVPEWTRPTVRSYHLVELVIYFVIALLLEIPVYYASTAVSGGEPTTLKTFVVPVVTAAVWGGAAVAAVVWLTPAYLLDPEHRSTLGWFIAAVVLGSLVVQAAFFIPLTPTSFLGGIMTSIFQLLLRVLLYVLLLAVNMVFLGLVQILHQGDRKATALAPLLDALAMLT